MFNKSLADLCLCWLWVLISLFIFRRRLSALIFYLIQSPCYKHASTTIDMMDRSFAMIENIGQYHGGAEDQVKYEVNT